MELSSESSFLGRKKEKDSSSFVLQEKYHKLLRVSLSCNYAY